MNLAELKQLLGSHPDRNFRLRLPDGSAVPQSFHVTEVGRVQKTFLDCGGKLRESITCQLQVWLGPDYDHRLETKKMVAILDKAKSYLSDESLEVEVEYEAQVISQYTINGFEVSEEAVVLSLVNKHTECLAPELCGLPPLPAAGKPRSSIPCCGPGTCC